MIFTDDIVTATLIPVNEDAGVEALLWDGSQFWDGEQTWDGLLTVGGSNAEVAEIDDEIITNNLNFTDDIDTN